jgi:hypothetical protein
VRGVCDAASYRLAQTQGYQPADDKGEESGVSVAGVSQPIDLVVITP